MCASSFLSKNFCCYPLRKVSKAMGGFKFTLQKRTKKARCVNINFKVFLHQKRVKCISNKTYTDFLYLQQVH